MKAQDLKNSILQLAIQGKLVEQRKEEGTAKELLEKIKAEKEKLIKEKKIKKEKPLPQITGDEIPFDIPESWEWVRLRNLGLTQTGNTPSKSRSDYFGDYIPFISPGDILNGVINYKNQGLSEKGKEIGRVSEKYSVLQVCIGGSIGKCAINTMDVAYNQQINAITPILCNYLYVYHLMGSKYFLINMKAMSTGTATPIINKSIWEELLVPLPPLEEQNRIVAKIGELMPYVEKYGDAHSKLELFDKRFPEDMQKSILQYAIQGKLVEQRAEEGTAEELYKQIQEEKAKLIKDGKIKKEKPLLEITEDEIPFEIPASWKWVRLGSLTELITKGSSPSWQGIKYVDDGLLFITSENVGVEQLLMNRPKYLEEKFNQIQERSILKKGDILTNIVGASIGRTAIYDRDELANINQAVCLIRLINKDINGYIIKYLNSYIAYKIMMNDKVDTARANISLTNISNFIVPLPPLLEQNRIVAKVEEMMLYCQHLIK